jgi:hypothetical protein
MKFQILVLLLIPSFLFSQGWERTYGGEDYDGGNSVQQTTDGGFIITGYTNSFSYGAAKDVYLIKTDNNGDTLWSKTYGNWPTENGNSVQQTSDGGFIIAGYNFSYGDYDIYLVKTDNNGDALWTKTFGGNGVDNGNSVQQTTDGGYIIAGGTGSFVNGAGDIYLIKIDGNGNTLWNKTYGGIDSDWGRSVQQTTDGGYIITGRTESYGNGEEDVYLIKTDSYGDSLWTKTFGGEYDDEGYSVQQTTDGGYVITGTTYSYGNGEEDVYLIKTDSYGDSLWTKTFGGEYDDEGYSVQQTTDGGYVITGFTMSYGNGEEDVYLIKTDSYGDSLWTKTFGGEYDDEGYSVQQTTDGGYIITGITYSNGNAYYEDVYLIKTDENGVITFTSEISIPNPNRKLIKTVDLLGRVISKPRKNQPYIEIYDDGTTQKKMKIK